MASPTAPLICCILVLYGALPSHGCTNVTQLSLALDTLLAAYDREHPPQALVVVDAVLDVRHAAIDDRASTVRMFADLRMYWQDDRLKWNASEWGCDSALVAAEQLWLPDVALVNAAASADAGDVALRARLNSSGAIEWVTRLDSSAPLDMQLERWPADEQSVTFMFCSKAHSMDELDLTLKPMPLKEVYQAGGWKLLMVKRSTSVWEAVAGRRRVLSWELVLQRRAAGAAHATAAILAAGVMLLLAAALLPPKERVPVAVAAALTAAFSLVSWTLRLPPSSSCPLVIRAVAALCACAGVASAAAALVQRVSLRTSPPPRLLCTLLSKVSTMCRLTSHQESESTSSGGGAGSGAWRAAALLLDRAVLAALLLAVLVMLICSLVVLL